MIHWLAPSKQPEVAKYIQCYWFLEKTPDAHGHDFPLLNPDPSAHLILYPEAQSFHYKLGNEISQGKGSHWLYPHCKTFELDHSKPFSCIGIKFRVGALYSLRHISNQQQNPAQGPHRILDAVNEIKLDGSVFNVDLDEKELISTAKKDANLCSELLDELLKPWLIDSFEDNHSEITRRALPLLAETNISELGNMLHCSKRTLERSFLRVTGLTLKQCQSINKLESILEYLYQRKQDDIDWSDLAYQFGFSDQPHFIRYLKQQINLTPQKYAEQRGFTIDIYGGIESK